MMSNSIPPVSIASGDLRPLKQVAVQAVNSRHPIGQFLLSELDRATVYDPSAVPSRSVRLNEWVTFRADDGEPVESRVLVLPGDFRNNQMHLSVLSPLGAALVGLHAGARIRYAGIDGVKHTATVENLDPPAGVVSLLQRRDMKNFARANEENPDPSGPTAA
jgi:regulator of nucleoside diphosphate kinase